MKNILIVTVLVAIGYFYLNNFGEKPENFISDVTLTSEGHRKSLGLDFTTPTRYLGHFPESFGDVVQIRVRAISFSGFKKNYSLRNSIVKAGSGSNSLIDDVRYEGDVPGGPFIIIKFTKQINFKVHEGEGLRSLNVSFDES